MARSSRVASLVGTASGTLGLVLLAACSEPTAGPVATPTPAVDAEAVPDGPLVRVDDLGFFVSTETVEGEWYAGPGVRGAVLHAGQLAGRFDDAFGEGDPTLWTRDADGAFIGVTPRREESAEPLNSEVAARMRAALGARSFSGLARRFAEAIPAFDVEPAAPRPAPLPPTAVVGEDRPAPLPAGTPLFGWAPKGLTAIRFRSIEAAFRFADVSDRVAQRLLVDEGDLRDHGSLRGALHNLLLPSIWRANPGGRKGVGECLLVLDETQARGYVHCALILRMTDPELHRMETIAGVALETSEDHRWRPERDPFPERRLRSGVRAFAGDCEVVATSPELLETILTSTERGVAETVARFADRAGLPPPSGRKRAFSLRARGAPHGPFAYPVGFGDDAEDGARALAAAFTGIAPPTPEPGFGALFSLDEPLRSVVSACADTSAAGARVSIRLHDPGAARALADRLQRGAPTPDATREACVRMLADLVPLGMVEPRASDVSERCFVWLGFRPVCPDGGTYRFHPVTGEPRCTVHGTEMAPKTGPGVAPSPISEVEVDGSLVTFLLSIDWGR